MELQQSIDSSNTAAAAHVAAAIGNVLDSVNGVRSELRSAVESGAVADERQSVVTVDEMPPLSGQTQDRVGVVYLLAAPQAGYDVGAMYRLVWSESDGFRYVQVSVDGSQSRPFPCPFYVHKGAAMYCIDVLDDDEGIDFEITRVEAANA